jgi:hypothetical protein
LERRSAIRYPLETEAVFRWGREFSGDGVTRDISALGAYIVSPVCPPLDAFTNLAVAFSTFAGAKNLQFQGDMRVVRVDNHVRKPGFAVVGKLAALSQDGEVR